MVSGAPNLENLARAKQLNAEAPAAREIDNLLAAAERQLHDARAFSLAPASRFSLAYNAAHALALAALRGAGYRPSSAGHRRIVFQVLEATAQAPRKLWLALDRYHERRNRMEYEGTPVSALEADDLVTLAAELQALIVRQRKRPRGE